jgi:hypothetical protein
MQVGKQRSYWLHSIQCCLVWNLKYFAPLCLSSVSHYRFVCRLGRKGDVRTFLYLVLEMWRKDLVLCCIPYCLRTDLAPCELGFWVLAMNLHVTCRFFLSGVIGGKWHLIVPKFGWFCIMYSNGFSNHSMYVTEYYGCVIILRALFILFYHNFYSSCLVTLFLPF